MTRIVIFADDVRDHVALLGQLRKITEESIGELRQRIEEHEPVVDYDTYGQSEYKAMAHRLRRIVDEITDDVALLSIYEIPRLATWRDREAISRFAIDRQVLRDTLQANARDGDAM